jgi:hypothetical protein
MVKMGGLLPSGHYKWISLWISSQVSCNKWINLGFLHKCHATSDDKWQIRLGGMSCNTRMPGKNP